MRNKLSLFPFVLLGRCLSMYILWIAIISTTLAFSPLVAANDNGQGNAIDCEDEPKHSGIVACRDYVEPERLMHRDDWDFMEGYKYMYSGTCSVGWHPRTAHFLVDSDCSKITDERMKSDAMKSIAYVKKHSSAKNFSEYYASLETASKLTSETQTYTTSAKTYTLEEANQDARTIWIQSCINFKSMKVEPAYKFYERYPKIQTIHVARIFSNATDTVKSTGGMINCAEQGKYSADIYTSDVDIRLKK